MSKTQPSAAKVARRWVRSWWVFLAGVAVVAVAAVVLSGRGSDANTVAGQAVSGGLNADHTLDWLAPTARRAPVQLTGATLSGRPWSVAGAAGKVVVLNVWGSWCPPCVGEAPALQKAWVQLSQAAATKGRVEFMGIDTRESSANGSAFVRSFRVTYPSLSDQSGQALLALQGAAPTQPVTLVLDPRGRIAARVTGPVSTDTLTGLVHDVLNERA